jgi:hypothetical protein
MRITLWVTTAAAALIAGTTFAGAQTGKTEGGASSSSGQMSQGSSQTGGASEQKGATQKGVATEQKSAKPGMAQGREERTEKKGLEGKEERSSQAGEKAQGPKNAQTDRSKQPGIAQGKEGSTEKKGAETGKSMGAAEKKGTEGRAQTQTEKKGTEGRVQTGAATTGGASGSVQLSQEQKTKVHEIVTKQSSARVESVDFSISVGIVVPRRVHLYALPQELVVIVPQYRKYKYVIVGDEILIIDPRTFRIVAVIPA